MTAKVYQGAQAPQAYVLDITPGDSGVDLSTVTDAEFQVLRPDGTEVTWAADMSNQTATTLTLTYEYVTPDPQANPPVLSDLAQADRYVILAVLTIPSGVVPCEPRALHVRGKFEAPS